MIQVVCLDVSRRGLLIHCTVSLPLLSLLLIIFQHTTLVSSKKMKENTLSLTIQQKDAINKCHIRLRWIWLMNSKWNCHKIPPTGDGFSYEYWSVPFVFCLLISKKIQNNYYNTTTVISLLYKKTKALVFIWSFSILSYSSIWIFQSQ